MIDEIGADRVVAARHERDLQLRADAVGARDEHGIAVPVAIEAEQAAERADLGQHAGRERGARERLDPADRLVAGVDVDAGLAVVHHCSRGHPRSPQSAQETPALSMVACSGSPDELRPLRNPVCR